MGVSLKNRLISGSASITSRFFLIQHPSSQYDSVDSKNLQGFTKDKSIWHGISMVFISSIRARCKDGKVDQKSALVY